MPLALAQGPRCPHRPSLTAEQGRGAICWPTTSPPYAPEIMYLTSPPSLALILENTSLSYSLPQRPPTGSPRASAWRLCSYALGDRRTAATVGNPPVSSTCAHKNMSTGKMTKCGLYAWPTAQLLNLQPPTAPTS